MKRNPVTENLNSSGLGATKKTIVTFHTLTGRLKRLHTLAELAYKPEQAQRLCEVLVELEVHEDSAEVPSELLYALRHRLLRVPTVEASRSESLPDERTE